MRRYFSRHYFVLVLACIFLGAACTKQWDKHNEILDPAVGLTLFEVISREPGLGKFSELLVKSGYDKLIASSKTFTVWAPNDQALATLDVAIVNDSNRLRQFLGNHITNQTYLAASLGAGQRLKMLNGKFLQVSSSKFDSANLVTSNRIAGNGVVHVVDRFVSRMENTWEWLNGSSAAPLMKSFLLSLNYQKFDPLLAEQTGVDPATGLPVYKPGTGFVARNGFLDTVLDLSNEASLNTFFVLTDAAYTAEFSKLSPWFKTGQPDSTNRLTGFWVVKDLAVPGIYTAAQLPDTILSNSGVKIPINKSAIVASYRTSNGMVHVMNQMNFALTSKFPPIIIQGERPTGFAADRSAQTFYRVRSNPATGQTFHDILLQNYNFASYFLYYRVPAMNSMRYNASWVAVNDVQTTPLWQQRLGVDTTGVPANLPYVTVAYQNYAEVSLGQINITNFRTLNLYVIGPTSASSTGGNNSISLDYIKLTPAF